MQPKKMECKLIIVLYPSGSAVVSQSSTHSCIWVPECFVLWLSVEQPHLHIALLLPAPL